MEKETTSKIMKTGYDPSLSGTDLLISVLEFMNDRKGMRLVVVGFEESEKEEYFHFTNARSQAEEAGIMRLCGKEITSLSTDEDEDE